MPIKNTHYTFGAISKLLHWSLVILIIIQYAAVVWTNYVLPENSPEAAFYIGKIHKPFGMLTLAIAILAIFWQFLNIHPTFPSMMATWEKRTARLVHTLLYLCLLLLPISGLIFSVAAGKPPNFFGLYQVPQFMEQNKMISQLFFDVHAVTGIFLVALIALHTLAALKHHFINRDPVLKRMM